MSKNFLFLLLLANSPGLVRSQEPSSPNPIGQDALSTSVANAEDKPFSYYQNAFENSFMARFGRAFEYDLQRVEQPRAVVTGTNVVVRNPEPYLNEHTLKFQFSELFLIPLR